MGTLARQERAHFFGAGEGCSQGRVLMKTPAWDVRPKGRHDEETGVHETA